MYQPFDRPCKFKIGDIVNLCTGYAPQRVIDIRECSKGISSSGWAIKTEYVKYSARLEYKNIRWRSDLDYDFYKSEPEKEIEMTKRYRSRTGFEGIQVGTTSIGHIVLEYDNGSVASYNPEYLTEIKPYGITVTNLITNSRPSTYNAEEGKFELGQLLLLNNIDLVRVIGLDTNHRGLASKHINDTNPKRLVMEDI